MVAILAMVPIHVPAGLHRALRAAMNNLAHAHSRRFRSLPEGYATLRYYQIFNCLVQLVTAGKNHAQGNTAGAYNSSDGVTNLINHVHLLTGLNLRLPG